MSNIKKISLNRNSAMLYVILVSVMASIFGFNLGATLSSKVRLINIFMLEVYDVDSIVNTFFLGAIAGFLLGGRLVGDAGRLQPILASFSFGAIGQCISLMSPTFSTLFITEFAIGASFGVYLIAVTCYLTEISGSRSRGFNCALPSFFFLSGLLLSLVLRYFISFSSISCISGIAIITVPLILFSYFTLPESPRWLALSSYTDRALSELIRLRSSASAAAAELAAINECALGEERGFSLFFRSQIFRSVVWYFVFVGVTCQLSGVFVIPYMSMQFINSHQSAMFLGILVPSSSSEINFSVLMVLVSCALLGAVYTMLLIDRIGRKRLFVQSLLINEIVIAVITVLLFAHVRSLPQIVSISLMCVYIFSSTISLILLFGVVASELFAAKGREFGLTVLYQVSILTVMICNYFFYRAVQSFGLQMLFFVFLMAGAFVFSLIYSGLPETRGKMLESMENTLFNERNLHALRSGISEKR